MTEQGAAISWKQKSTFLHHLSRAALMQCFRGPGGSALPEGLLGTTLLAGFLAMLVLDVLHQSVSGDADHSHRGSPTTHSAANGNLEHQRHSFGEQQASTATSGSSIAAFIVR